MSDIANYRTDHLFLLVGTNPLPNLVAARLLANKQVHLFFSEDTEREGIPVTDEYAGWLTQMINKDPSPNLDIKSKGLNDVFSEKIYGTVKKEIDSLVRAKELKQGDTVGLNYTGATKPMSVHTYRSIAEHLKNRGFEVIFSYLDPRRLSLIFDGDMHPYKIEPDMLEINMETMVRLHGYKIPPGSGREKPDSHTLPIAKAIGEVCMKGQLPAWQHWINGDMQELPFANGPLAPVSKAFSEVCEKTGNPFTSQGLATAMGKYPAIIKYSKWLRSTWLEEIALAAMVELQNELPLTSPMAGIEPVPVRNSKKHSGEEMNFELDLAAIYGHQLFAISCIASDRSGGETKKHLMEAYVRAQQLGGEEARVALLCCADNADEIARELKQEWHVDKHVKVFDRRSLYDLKGGFRSWILENRKVK